MGEAQRRILKFDLSKSDAPPVQVPVTEETWGQSRASQGGVSQSTAVIVLNDIAYFVQQEPEYPVQLINLGKWNALTSISTGEQKLTTGLMQSLVDYYRRSDDVFCDHFLQTILLLSDETHIDEDVLRLFSSWGCRTVFLLSAAYGISNGPYFFSCSGIFRAWRIYPDTQDAFVLSTIPSQKDKNTYQLLNASAYPTCSRYVAVPSRLYYETSPEKPLAGARIAIKDLFHLEGVRTTCGNRAYANLYPDASQTSEQVQRAIDKGAIVVGKTKTAGFGGSQEVLGDWCDYSYAFNSRADGYLVSTGSNTGSASAMTAYEWLDFTLGTDAMLPEAGGSVRDPAVAHGIFGLRPTHDGSVERDAAVPCPIFQRSGYFSRSIEAMVRFGENWLDQRSRSSKLTHPNWVIFPVEYHADRDDVQVLIDRFATTLSKSLGVQTEKLSIEHVWSQKKPVETTLSFADYFEKTFIDILSHDYWTSAAQFRNEYYAAHGSAPYVCPTTQWLWRHAATVKDRKPDALAEVKTHNSWFLENILEGQDGQTFTLIIVPRYDLRYRDEYLCPPEKRSYYGWDSNLHASLAGLPNIIVPVGQCKFHSEISNNEEVFPVSASITAPKGTDKILLNFLCGFPRAHDLPCSVSTGKEAFPSGNTVQPVYNDLKLMRENRYNSERGILVREQEQKLVNALNEKFGEEPW